MSKNRQGGFSGRSVNGEWGRKARKEEADLRGLNNRARKEAVASAVADMTAEEDQAIAELIAMEDLLWS